MAKVTGIRGVFFKSKGDPAALAAWWQKHLGMPLEPWERACRVALAVKGQVRAIFLKTLNCPLTASAEGDEWFHQKLRPLAALLGRALADEPMVRRSRKKSFVGSSASATPSRNR